MMSDRPFRTAGRYLGKQTTKKKIKIGIFKLVARKLTWAIP